MQLIWDALTRYKTILDIRYLINMKNVRILMRNRDKKNMMEKEDLMKWWGWKYGKSKEEVITCKWKDEYTKIEG